MTLEVFSKLIGSMILIWNLHMPLPRTLNTKFVLSQPLCACLCSSLSSSSGFPWVSCQGECAPQGCCPLDVPQSKGSHPCQSQILGNPGRSQRMWVRGRWELRWRVQCQELCWWGGPGAGAVGKHRGFILFWKPSYCMYRRCSQSHNTWMCFGVFSNIRSGREPN